jgi:hypothetical protein
MYSIPNTFHLIDVIISPNDSTEVNIIAYIQVKLAQFHRRREYRGFIHTLKWSCSVNDYIEFLQNLIELIFFASNIDR